MIGPAKKLPVALCQLNNRGRLSVGRATAQSAESTNVLMEKTTKRYGEKGEEREFSPFLGVDEEAYWENLNRHDLFQKKLEMNLC